MRLERWRAERMGLGVAEPNVGQDARGAAGSTSEPSSVAEAPLVGPSGDLGLQSGTTTFRHFYTNGA